MSEIKVLLDEVTGKVILDAPFALVEINTLEELELLQAQIADAVHTMRSRNCGSLEVKRHKVPALSCVTHQPATCKWCGSAME